MVFEGILGVITLFPRSRILQRKFYQHSGTAAGVRRVFVGGVLS